QARAAAPGNEVTYDFVLDAARA
ncbi:MAG: hypothetical protein QOH19_1876, partial [Actinomycetota bacterium]|nr:hypothetical protein [Actinomycetota bacterium]